MTLCFPRRSSDPNSLEIDLKNSLGCWGSDANPRQSMVSPRYPQRSATSSTSTCRSWSHWHRRRSRCRSALAAGYAFGFAGLRESLTAPVDMFPPSK
jgi:hypothetical protein